MEIAQGFTTERTSNSTTLFLGAFEADQNADYVTIPLGGIDDLSVELGSLTADSAEVQVSINGGVTFNQVLDNSDTNPFTENVLKRIAVSTTVTHLRIVKSGQ